MDRPRDKSGLILVIALLSLAAAGKAVLYDTLDPDCFWHLRVAEQLHRDGIGPLVDQISYASIKTPWTPYSWLAELGMKTVWDLGGYRAAVLVQALVMGAFVVIVAMCATQLQRHQNPLAVVLATAFAMYFSLPYLSFRPVTFAIVMLALCAWLLLRDRRLGERSRAAWLVVPTTVLITNCHFFAVLVPFWVAALLAGAVIEQRNVKRYAMMLAACTAACAATPMLPGMIRAMWAYQFSDPMVGAGIIAEFQPVWSGALGFVSVMLLAGWVGCWWWNRERLRAGELIWAVLALLLLLRLGRFAPVFAPIAAATLAATLPQLSAAALNRQAARVAVAGVLLVGLIRIALAFPGPDVPLNAWLNRHGPGTPGFPTAAADYVAAHVPPGRIINEFSWGGYLSWRLGEHYQVFLDGRTQLYTPALWQAVYVDPAARLADNADAGAAIVPLKQGRIRAALLESGWVSAYHDDRAEVLLPPTSPAINASINE